MTEPRQGPDLLPLWPEELQHLVRQLLDAREAGDLGEGEVRGIARMLVAGDGAGHLWAVGLRTGVFHRWDGAGWLPDEPSGRLLLLPPEGIPEPALEEVPSPPSEGTPPGQDAVMSPPPAQAPANRRCPRCGVVLRPGARFCTRCGSSVTPG